MFFHRKPRNRRLGRDYVLDVKLRSSQVRAARLRVGSLAVTGLLATGLSLFVLWRAGEWALNRFVYQNKAFALDEIDVQTDGVIGVEQLRRWAGVKPADNLLALDLARVKRDLELAPLVQSASVERILPRTLRIRVIEREPLAQASLVRPRAGGGLETSVFQLDAEGYVMLPLDLHQRSAASGQPADQLPVIIGVNPAELQAGRRIEAPQVRAALQLLAIFDQSPMAGLVDLQRIDVSASETLAVTTGQGAEVTFGLNNLEQQLRRWRSIYDLGQKTGKAVATLDLAVANNIPTRWLEASAAPLAPVKSPKPSHYKKKHV